MTRITKDGISLIKSFESCSLLAYWDQEGKRWTLGWGRARGISEGETCTQERADIWLMDDLSFFEIFILQALEKYGVPLTDNQLSALVSFCYNVGLGYKGVKDGFYSLASGEPSTMFKCLRVGDYAGAAAEFPKWDKAGGVVSAGILRRRLAEQALFLSQEVCHGPN